MTGYSEKTEYAAAFKGSGNISAYGSDNIPVYEGERTDDLQFKGMKLIQSNNSFCFGTDSVLLAGFASPLKNDNCVDLGAGSGVLSVLLNARVGCRMTAVETDPIQCGRMKRSVRMNGQEGGIRVLNLDYVKEKKLIGMGEYDSAVCNPPYFKVSGKGTSIPKYAEATHDAASDIFKAADSASFLLKFGGKLFVCFPASALCELFAALNRAKLEPKRMRLVAASASSKPYLVLIEAKKGAKRGLIIENTLIIHSGTGDYTDEAKGIYHL